MIAIEMIRMLIIPVQFWEMLKYLTNIYIGIPTMNQKRYDTPRNARFHIRAKNMAVYDF
jgi:hypothetical protein